MITPVVNNENTMTDKKKIKSRESSTPFLNPVKVGHHAERRDGFHQPG